MGARCKAKKKTNSEINREVGRHGAWKKFTERNGMEGRKQCLVQGFLVLLPRVRHAYKAPTHGPWRGESLSYLLFTALG